MTRTPYDPSRRRFFRSFAGDVVAGAVQAMGAVGALRAEAADGVTTYLSDPPMRAIPQDPEAGGHAFRWASGTTLLVVDQRVLPDRVAEVSIESAAEAAWIIRDRVVADGPVLGQVAAIGLALTARRSADSTPSIMRALLEGSANALRTARSSDPFLSRAVDRMMARYRSLDAAAPGSFVAEALRVEADGIADEAADDHVRLAESGWRVLGQADGRVLNVLTHGASGPLSGGRYGTALGVVTAAHVAGRKIHVWVDETRPRLEGSRVTAWELRRARIPHTVIADVSAGHLIAAGEVDAVVVGAHRVAANGDVANTTGTYPLAVLAARHGVPFYVCEPLSSVDLGWPDRAPASIDDGDPGEIASIVGIRVAPSDTVVANPRMDVTPAELITGLITEEGVLRAPYERTLAGALDRRAARPSTTAGVGATARGLSSGCP